PFEPLQLPQPEANERDECGEHQRGEAEKPSCHRPTSLPGKLALLRLVLELERDQDALEGPEQKKGQQDGERAPQQGVKPIRRGIEDFGYEREARYHEPGHEDDEDSWSVA